MEEVWSAVRNTGWVQARCWLKTQEMEKFEHCIL